VAATTVESLDTITQNGLRNALGEVVFQQIRQQPLLSLTDQEKTLAVQELGRRSLTEIYRQLLLTVITELWVDYLTQMEALRVSIGLEAYAQRDPLVQYKNRAFGLFQDLLNNMRSGVVTRMFTYRPRDLSAVQTSVSRQEGAQPENALPENGGDPEMEMQVEEDAGEDVEETETAPASGGQSGKNKRRRRRKR
jgi:preprotein translocase subunit SecA